MEGVKEVQEEEEGEDDRYADVVLHGILDNPAFEEGVMGGSITSSSLSSSFTDQGKLGKRSDDDDDDDAAAFRQQFLGWVKPFLESISSSPTGFPNALATLTSTFLDRFQKTRFGIPARTTVLLTALEVMWDVIGSGSEEGGGERRWSLEELEEGRGERWPFAKEGERVLDLHAGFLARVGFGEEFDPEVSNKKGGGGGERQKGWKEGRERVRGFMKSVLGREAGRLVENVDKLARFSMEEEGYQKAKLKAEKVGKKVVATKPTPPEGFRYSKALWERVFESIRPSDPRGVAVILEASAKCSHLENLSGRTWLVKALIKPQMVAVNAGLTSIRDPLLDLLLDLADDRGGAVLLDFLGVPGVAQHMATLLLSPVEKVHNTAQGLVKQAFDVTTRRECFRSLLFQFPMATLKGIMGTTRAFVKTARVLPEATGFAKRLVRCLSDVIEVLCGTTDGLLREEAFLIRGEEGSGGGRGKGGGVRAKLAGFWKVMGDALATLFKMTPTWSAFFENEQMTEWMRDAILFGGDMLDQVRTFELIISGQGLSSSMTSAASPIKAATGTGFTMVTALSDPLEELIAWLRLNDRDLLLSSYELVMRMVHRFHRSKVPLRDSLVAKVERLVDKALNPVDPNAVSSVLRRDQLRALRDAVVGSSGSEVMEVIEIVSDDDDRPPVKKVKERERATPSSQASLMAALNGKPASSFLKPVKPTVNRQTLPSIPVKASPFASAPRPMATSSLSRRGLQVSSAKLAKAPQKVVAAAPRARGVPWTSYVSKPDTLSSEEGSSEDESSGEEDGKPKVTGLAALAKAQNAPKIRKEERRAVKLLDVPGMPRAGHVGGRGVSGPTREQQELAAANAEKLRRAQDFSHLHRKILRWDSKALGDLPPGMDKAPGLLPSSFATPNEYFAAFEPLLLIECWAQLVQAREKTSDESPPIPVTIAGRQNVDDFLDVFLTIQHGQLPDRTFFGESDLVLLRQGPLQTLAKVQSFGRKREFFELTLRCNLGDDPHQVGSRLGAKTQWEIVKMMQLSTTHREYSALQTMAYLPICQQILQPRPPPQYQEDPRTVQRTMQMYQVNEPQATAILGSLKTPGFSLIQGPPGTGKTKTILGLVGAFMDSRPRVAVPIAVGRQSAPATPPPVAKVLLCAPSNAAVDEVAKRLMEGVRNSDGKVVFPKVVRIGADASVDIAVKAIFIDELVERALGENNGEAGGGNNAPVNLQAMRIEVEDLRLQRNAKRSELELMDNNDARTAELAAEFKKIKARINDLSQKLDSEKDKAQQAKRKMDAHQRKVRFDILSEADVICSTLSGAGHDYMAKLPFDFETVIIDEAAQSIELSSLIPLKYGCRRCIMVGDPLQLPPTVISIAAGNSGYQRSLFVRMMQRGQDSVHLLSIQYRMHPYISAFPSAAFYNSRLTDGPSMDTKTAQPWHKHALFPPYSFLHVAGNEVSGRHHSWTNPVEALTAVAIYERLLKEYPSAGYLDYRIGIVTPYKGQVGELKKQFRNKFGQEVLTKISFNTVDGFQGQEKDIIILSCVRGGSEKNAIGFLADTRRMNVALTRARSSLWILGDQRKLRSNRHWNNLVSDAESRGLLLEVSPTTYLSKHSMPPPIISSAVSVSVNKAKSNAKAIQIDTPLFTPQQMAASSKSASSTPSGPPIAVPTGPRAHPNVKRRVADEMGVGMEKKPKLVEVEEGEITPDVPSLALAAAHVVPPPKPPARPMPAPAPRKPTSLFMPKKRPLPGGGVSGPPSKR